MDLVAAISPHGAFATRAQPLIRAGEHLEMLRCPEVDGPEGEPARRFLRELLARRLSAAPGAQAAVVEQNPGRQADSSTVLPPEILSVVDEAIRWSGGVPRTFLQLVANARTYARLRGSAWPKSSDLADAVAAQRDSFRRVLLPGDPAAIRAAEGTDGRQLHPDRRARLMAHGVLLEKLYERRPVLSIHPLARASLDQGAADA